MSGRALSRFFDAQRRVTKLQKLPANPGEIETLKNECRKPARYESLATAVRRIRP